MVVTKKVITSKNLLSLPSLLCLLLERSFFILGSTLRRGRQTYLFLSFFFLFFFLLSFICMVLFFCFLFGCLDLVDSEKICLVSDFFFYYSCGMVFTFLLGYLNFTFLWDLIVCFLGYGRLKNTMVLML